MEPWRLMRSLEGRREQPPPSPSERSSTLSSHIISGDPNQRASLKQPENNTPNGCADDRKEEADMRERNPIASSIYEKP
jgi:hypothetical protein